MEKLKLTNDPTRNIRMMLPLLDNETKEKISYMMFGSYLMMPVEKEWDSSKEKETLAIK